MNEMLALSILHKYTCTHMHTHREFLCSDILKGESQPIYQTQLARMTHYLRISGHNNSKRLLLLALSIRKNISIREPISPWSPFLKKTNSHLEVLLEQCFLMWYPWKSIGIRVMSHFTAHTKKEVQESLSSLAHRGNTDAHWRPGLRCGGDTTGEPKPADRKRSVSLWHQHANRENSNYMAHHHASAWYCFSNIIIFPLIYVI